MLPLWENVLLIGGLGVEDDFFELGGDSLAAVALFVEIERVFGKKPALSSLLEYPTARKLAGLVDVLDTACDPSPSALVKPPAVAIRAEGSLPPLFLVHGGGGNVLFGRQLLPFLDPEQPVYGIAARGLIEGEAAHTDLDAMTADYLAAVRRIQPKGPYYLSGFCVGSLLAYEMARRLRAAGESVALVIKIDPDFNRVLTPWLYWQNPDALAIRALRIFVGLAWQGWLIKQQLKRDLLFERRPSQSPVERRRYRAIAAGLHSALRGYRPGSFDGKMAILCSGDRIQRLSDPHTGWPAIVRGVTIIEIAPDHRTIFDQELPKVAGAIEALLKTTRPAAPLRQHADAAAE